jgi:hypothetical protein
LTAAHNQLAQNQLFLSDERSMEDLFSRMMSPDREQFATFKSLKVEAAFIDRIFILYKPMGLNAEGTHRPPEIITQIKVTDFRLSAKNGAEVDLEDLKTGEVMTIGYIPSRLFNYDIFIGVAPRQRISWDAALYQGTIRRSLSFMLLTKVRSGSGNYSHGATGIATPAGFRQLYPSVTLTLNT